MEQDEILRNTSPPFVEGKSWGNTEIVDSKRMWAMLGDLSCSNLRHNQANASTIVIIIYMFILNAVLILLHALISTVLSHTNLASILDGTS